MMTVLAQATRPTARSVRWLPLLGLAGLLSVVAALAGSADGPVDTVLLLSTAALAAGVVAALHDPAAAVLAAVPVSLMQRRALRLLIVGLPAVATWWSLAELTAGATVAGLGRLLALTSAGVAVAVWAAPRHRAVLLGASAAAAWFAVDRLSLLHGLGADVAGWWRTDPWTLLAAMSVACFLRRTW